MEPDDQTVGEHLLRRFGPTSEGQGPMPDEVWIAALVEGRLPPAQRQAVEEALLQNPEARALAADMVALVEEEALEEEPAEDLPASTVAQHARRRWIPIALAASLLIAVGAGLHASGVLGGKPHPSRGQRLTAAAKVLGREAPDLFGDFRSLTAAERSAPGERATRGGITPIEPAARILTPAPAFRWLPIPGATLYKIVVLDDAGETVYMAEAARPPLRYGESQASPPLQRGRTYVWEISTEEGPLGPVVGRRSFVVGSQAEADRFESARRVVSEHISADLQELLLAQAAIHWDLLAEAEQLLRARLGEHPGDRLVRETLSYVLRKLGDANAAAALDRGD